MATWEEINYLAFLVTWENDRIQPWPAEKWVDIMYYGSSWENPADRWCMPSAPFSPAFPPSCCWSFDGVVGALAIILHHDSIGWQTSALGGAWAAIPAFDHLRFVVERYNLLSCLSHSFSALCFVQPDLILTDVLIYFRPVLGLTSMWGLIFIVFLFSPLCLIIYSHVGVLCQGLIFLEVIGLRNCSGLP